VREHIIIRRISALLIPFMQLYALYVLAHGELGPGGGFQGGVIFGASIILYVIAFGLEEGKKRIGESTRDILNSVGVLIYAGVGLLCLMAGGAYLEYGALPFDSVKLASSLGVFGIEIGVAITVATVMITIFFETARHDD